MNEVMSLHFKCSINLYRFVVFFPLFDMTGSKVQRINIFSQLESNRTVIFYKHFSIKTIIWQNYAVKKIFSKQFNNDIIAL